MDFFITFSSSDTINVDDADDLREFIEETYGDDPLDQPEIETIESGDNVFRVFPDIKSLEDLEAFCEFDHDNDHKRAALYWLGDNLGLSLRDALDKVDDVCIFEGTAEQWAREYIDDCYNLSATLQMYFNYRDFADDCQMGGDIDEFYLNGDDWVVTNANAL